MILDELIGSSSSIAAAWTELMAAASGTTLLTTPPLAQSPRDELALEGGARLLHFRAPEAARRTTSGSILLVPSLINRWYVLDLRPTGSVVEALVSAGFDVWVLDWGCPHAEDRELDWDALSRRLGRAVRRVCRETKQPKIGLLGYCLGGTLSTIYTAQHPDEIAAFVALATPVDFSLGGQLRRMTDPRWFDADAVAAAGNVTPFQMQSGFSALRPFNGAANLAKIPQLLHDVELRDVVLALNAWNTDTIPFPGEAYRRYITELYQGNQLVLGTHRVNGVVVKLSAITCPVLAVSASRDTICPPAATNALLSHVSSTDVAELQVPGGHVGGVIGRNASRALYPGLVNWLASRLV